MDTLAGNDIGGDAGRIVHRLPVRPPAPRPSWGWQTLSRRDRERLDILRRLAVRSRLQPRSASDRACLLIVADRTVSMERIATFLFRALDEDASGDAFVYRPGTTFVSPFESWLLRVLDAWSTGRDAQAAALVSWGVRRRSVRWIGHLTSRLAEELQSQPDLAH